jgi:hypothetical protein
MIHNIFYKIIILVVTIIVSIFSLTYFTRTIIDVGCAQKGERKDVLNLRSERKFFSINCWMWERSVQYQKNSD